MLQSIQLLLDEHERYTQNKFRSVKKCCSRIIYFWMNRKVNSVKISVPLQLINKDLSNETTLSLIHLAGQYL
jgi:hypothetical protein